MKIISRLFLSLLLVATIAACTSSGVSGGSTDDEGIENGSNLEDLSGQAAAVACTTNADCAGVFEANSCVLAACDAIEEHCTAVTKAEGTTCKGPAGGCGGIGEGICDASGACEVDLSTVEEAGCDDDNPCTTDECHPDMGCLYVHVEDGEGCDDGDPCTDNGACSEGVCEAEAIANCEEAPDEEPLDECLAEACPAEWEACMADDGCATAAMCMLDCDQNDEGDACEYACMIEIPADSRPLFEDVGECGEVTGCIKSDDPDDPDDPDVTPPDDPTLACIADACPDLWSDCMGDQGCADTVGCLMDCGDDEACTDECFASIPPMSQLVFLGLLDCAGNSGCNEADPGDDDPTVDCLEEQCGGEFSACTGSQGCLGLIGCMDGCPDGDQGCSDACFEDASPKAQNEWWELVICGSEEGCFEDQPEDAGQCLDKQCGDEIEDCLDDAGCQGIFACQDECGDDDEGCKDDCAQDASPDAQELYYSLVICGVENDCWGPGSDDPTGECLTDQCGDSYFDCVLGDPECVDIFECMEECPEGDKECNDDCFDDASPSAQDSWEELVQCGQDNGCLETPGGGGEDPEENPIVECLQGKCPASFEDCVDDSGCLTISPCLETCDDDDDGCKDECFEDAGEESTQKWWSVVNCGVDKGCIDDLAVDQPDGPQPNGSAYECIMASCEVGDYGDVPGGKATLNCIASCEDALCAENCVDDAPDAGQDFASEAAACAVDSGCLDPTTIVPDTCGNGNCDGGEDGKNCPEDCNEPDSPNSCIQAQCTAEIEACEDTGGCGDAFACWSAPGCDQGCKFQCLSDLGGAAEQSFEEVLSCGDTHGCFEGPPPDGEAECGNDICEKGEDGFNCSEDCKPPGGGDGPGGGDDPDPEDPDTTIGDELVECTLNACEEEVTECLLDQPCAKVLTCISLCDDNDCLEDCVEDSELPATFWPVVECSEVAGCTTGDFLDD